MSIADVESSGCGFPSLSDAKRVPCLVFFVAVDLGAQIRGIRLHQAAAQRAILIAVACDDYWHWVIPSNLSATNAANALNQTQTETTPTRKGLEPKKVGNLYGILERQSSQQFTILATASFLKVPKPYRIVQMTPWLSLSSYGCVRMSLRKSKTAPFDVSMR